MPQPFLESLFATPAALMLLAAAAGTLVSHNHLSNGKTYTRRVLGALARALFVLVLGWVFGLGLNNLLSTLQLRQEQLEAESAATAQTLWAPNTSHLNIYQEREEEVREQVPREDKDGPSEWSTVKIRVATKDYSITQFRGDINLQIGEREKDGRYYSGYLADTDVRYEIRNDAEIDSEVHFELWQSISPYSTGPDIEIWMDYERVTPEPESVPGRISWKANMKAGQTSSLRIHSTASGTDVFEYRIPDAPINDCLINIRIDQIQVAQVKALLAASIPTSIHPTEDGRGSVLTWQLNRAATQSFIYLRLPKVEPPEAAVLRALSKMPSAVILLAGLLTVTMLLWQSRVSLIDLSFFMTIFALEFLVLAVMRHLPGGLWVGLGLGLLLCLLMAWRWWVWRKPSKPGTGRLYWLLLGLFTVIALLSPLSSLWQSIEKQNAIQLYIQIGMVLLLIGLWLFTRQKPDHATQAIVVEAQGSVNQETAEKEATDGNLRA